MSSEQDYQDLFGPQAKKAKRGRPSLAPSADVSFEEQLQTDKSANAIRIRDNQRRSRARHKEFVDELQRKVQEYEKRGIEASVQMQKAARDVSIENARLKALLASRGVSGEQVEAYLRSFDDDNKGSPAIPHAVPIPPGIQGEQADALMRNFDDDAKASPAPPLAATLPPILSNPVTLEPSAQLPPLQEHFSKARFPPEPEPETNGTKRKYGEALMPPVLTLTPTPDVQQSSPLDKLTMLANASLNRVTQLAPKQKFQESARSPHYYDRRSQTPPRPSESYHPPQASPHEMSCNAAAQIIADMQGYGDQRTARIALGCRSQEDECFVKNTAVFRALDHRSLHTADAGSLIPSGAARGNHDTHPRASHGAGGGASRNRVHRIGDERPRPYPGRIRLVSSDVRWKALWSSEELSKPPLLPPHTTRERSEMTKELCLATSSTGDGWISWVLSWIASLARLFATA